MRSKKPKATVENIRTFTIKSLKQPVRYDIEQNMLAMDEGLPGNQDPTRTMDMPKDAKIVGINEFSTDPEHKAIWVAALPQINEFRVKDGLPELQGYNANYAGQEVPNPELHIDESAEVGLEEVFEPPPQPSQAQFEQPQMSRYPGSVSDDTKQYTQHPQSAPSLEYIPVTHQTLVTNLKLVNNTLMDFLHKHVGEEDPDWKIIEGMMETCDELYKDWEGDARAFIRSSR